MAKGISGPPPFTLLELELLELCVGGWTTGEMAARRGRSAQTILNERRRLLGKLAHLKVEAEKRRERRGMPG